MVTRRIWPGTVLGESEAASPRSREPECRVWGRLSVQPDMYRLCIHVLRQPGHSVIAPEARLLISAKRRIQRQLAEGIYPHGACGNRLRREERLVNVAGMNGAGQTIDRVIRQSNSFLGVGEGLHCQDGAEDLI